MRRVRRVRCVRPVRACEACKVCEACKGLRLPHPIQGLGGLGLAPGDAELCGRTAPPGGGR